MSAKIATANLETPKCQGDWMIRTNTSKQKRLQGRTGQYTYDHGNDFIPIRHNIEYRD